jgi:hypothetical protein
LGFQRNHTFLIFGSFVIKLPIAWVPPDGIVIPSNHVACKKGLSANAYANACAGAWNRSGSGVAICHCVITQALNVAQQSDCGSSGDTRTGRKQQQQQQQL